MPEVEQDNRLNNIFIPATEELPVMMTMDPELDGCWTFDQIFLSDPSPPSFILSATEQTFSPLWTFSDDNCGYRSDGDGDGDGKLARSATWTSTGAAQRLLSEKKRRKAEKLLSFEVLQQHFGGSLKDAAKNLGVCPTSLKRICRQHGISRWPSRKINKVNRSLTKLKQAIESVQGAKGTFTLPSFPTAPKCSPGCKSFNPPYPNNNQRPTIQTSGSMEANTSSPNSNRSCQEETEKPFRQMLTADSRSSHDLTSPEKVEQLAPKVQPVTHKSEVKRITIKAYYKEDIIRFRVAANSGLVTMKEEVSKRLRLDVDTFDVKYLDDDLEWVLIACDADLQECVELYGCNIIRLLVHNLLANFRSSCESSN